MTTVFMPSTHPVSAAFSIAGFRNVDEASDHWAYYGYLDSVAEAFREVIVSGIDQLRLRTGDAVLDAGCGHGGSAALLAQRVGPSGRVAGLDASRAMIAEAHRRYDDKDLPIEFQVGDSLALPFQDASFDAARSDRVFMFVDDPIKALSELVRVTRPGGRIVVTEGDMGSHCVDASDAVTTRSVLAALSDRSPNGWSGRRLRGMFVEIGLRDIELQLIPLVTTSFVEWNNRIGAERHVTNLKNRGSDEHEKAAAWLDDLRERDAAGTFTGVASLYMATGTTR